MNSTLDPVLVKAAEIKAAEGGEFEGILQTILQENDPRKGSIYSQRTLWRGRRHVNDGTYSGMWVADPAPPQGGDTVTNGTSDLAARCHIPVDPGVIFQCRADLLLPESPAYRVLAEDVCLGADESFGVRYAVRRNFYVTLSPAFDAGERDARSGAAMSPPGGHTEAAEYRRGWFWGNQAR